MLRHKKVQYPYRSTLRRVPTFSHPKKGTVPLPQVPSFCQATKRYSTPIVARLGGYLLWFSSGHKKVQYPYRSTLRRVPSFYHPKKGTVPPSQVPSFCQATKRYSTPIVARLGGRLLQFFSGQKKVQYPYRSTLVRVPSFSHPKKGTVPLSQVPSFCQSTKRYNTPIVARLGGYLLCFSSGHKKVQYSYRSTLRRVTSFYHPKKGTAPLSQVPSFCQATKRYNTPIAARLGGYLVFVKPKISPHAQEGT